VNSGGASLRRIEPKLGRGCGHFLPHNNSPKAFECGLQCSDNNKRGYTAIYYAVASLNKGLVDAFMGYNQYHKEMLSSALKLGQLSQVDPLLNDPVDTWHTFDGGHTTVLHLATESGFVDVVDHILQKDDKRELLDEQNGAGRTPLLLAAVAENLEVMDVLIRAGANLNAQDRLGNTSLHLAAKDDLIEVVKLLLKADARLDTTNIDGQTAYA
jgi:ankyrin repeat protein